MAAPWQREGGNMAATWQPGQHHGSDMAAAWQRGERDVGNMAATWHRAGGGMAGQGHRSIADMAAASARGTMAAGWQRDEMGASGDMVARPRLFLAQGRFPASDMKWPMRRGGRPLRLSPSPLPHRRASGAPATSGDGRGQKRARSRGSMPAKRPPGPKSRHAAEGGAEHFADLVGSVSETREEHLKRHDGGRRTCPRCRFYLHGATWCAAYGTSSVRVGAHRSVWLSERPPRWGGIWSLGCAFCADLLARKQ